MPEASSLQPKAASVASEETELRPELYREIFAHSREPIAIISTQGHYLEQNAAHCELLGYSNEELLGESPALHLGEDVFESITRQLAEKASIGVKYPATQRLASSSNWKS